MKKVFSMLLIISLLCSILLVKISSAAVQMPYSDVSEKDWFHDSVSYVYEKVLMKGITNTIFAPNIATTRAMFITVLGRLADAPKIETDKFSDITRNSWYSGYAGWAVENAVITGFADGTFCPNEELTRTQMTAIIARYLQYTKIIPTRDLHAPMTFEDSNLIDSWASSYVDEIRKTGIVRGDVKGNFNPKETANRAQVATVVKRLHEMLFALSLEEPIMPSYLIQDEDFNLLGAWDLNYAGSALTTSYNGTKVDTTGEIPFITNDSNGRKVLYYSETDGKGVLRDTINPFATGNFVGLDLRILCINPNDYPVIRIGYKTSDASSLNGGFYAGTTDYINFNIKSQAAQSLIAEDDLYSGWRYSVIDLSKIPDYSWTDEDSEVFATFNTTSTDINIDVLYCGMFKTEAEAQEFNVNNYRDYLCSENNAIKHEINYTQINQTKLLTYMNDAQNRKNEIINSTQDIDSSKVNGTCYYVSSQNGNDNNDGLSPNTSWKSVSKLYTYTEDGAMSGNIIKFGDAVFFERGSVFYGEIGSYQGGNSVLNCVDGATYAAFGEGKKPIFTNALDINGSMNWSETQYENIYKLENSFKVPSYDVALGYSDVGNIVFNDGEFWGVKVVPHDSMNPYLPDVKTLYCGKVTNGKDAYVSGGTTFENFGCLTNNLEYFHDWTDNSLYLYCEDGNPGEIFDSIIISPRGNCIEGANNVILDNLAMLYTGVIGVANNNCENFIMHNCSFEWIGGCVQEDTTRFGNAFENWGNCDGISVTDNYINQCYDTGFTTQCFEGVMKNMTVSENVIEKCTMPVEFFNAGYGEEGADILANIFIRNNIILYSGYGFGNQRPDKKAAFFYGSNWSKIPHTNIIIENNINLYSTYFCLSDVFMARGAKTAGIITRNNTYLLNRNLCYVGCFSSNIVNLMGNNFTYFPYTAQYIQYIANLGIDRDSTFYFYDDAISDMERDGIYKMPEIVGIFS